MKMDKKSLLVLVLISVLWLVWFLVFRPDQRGPQKTPKKETPVAVKEKEASEGSKKAERITVKDAGMKSTGEVTVSTKNYSVTFSPVGAAIKSIKDKSRNVELVVEKNPFNAKGIFDFALHLDSDEFMSGNALDTGIWKLSAHDDSSVHFSMNAVINDIPVTIEKDYTFTPKDHFFRVSYSIKNNGTKPFRFSGNRMIVSSSDMIGPRLEYSNDVNSITNIYYLNDSYKDSKKGGGSFFTGCFSSKKNDPFIEEKGTIGWTGLMSRYFLVIMIPEKFTGSGVIMDNREKHGFRTGMYVPIKAIQPGETVNRSFKVYVGEKDKAMLATVDKKIKDAADISLWIEPIRNFVLWCLIWINKFCRNMGWSLVVFSIITKAVFMPLTIKSTESMKKMQQLSPKLNELKVKYKDKPEMLQKEMMKLYKENKVNPFGGCIPILLQMPFFFALYSALINSIDLWNAPFIWWIKDLSMPDTVGVLFGYPVNILPLLMTGTTFVLQKFTTVDTGGPQQKAMMLMMPVMFIFIFWSMPSGLVLYWTLQNVFQIAHQLIVNLIAKRKPA